MMTLGRIEFGKTADLVPHPVEGHLGGALKHAGCGGVQVPFAQARALPHMDLFACNRVQEPVYTEVPQINEGGLHQAGKGEGVLLDE